MTELREVYSAFVPILSWRVIGPFPRDGKVHRIPKKDIEERVFSSVSTTPNGLSDGMTLQDFADLIAFWKRGVKRKNKSHE